MIIDTHCHLDFPDFDRDRDDVIDRAKKAGVTAIINVGSSIEGTNRAFQLARSHDIVYATLGVHPHEAKSVTDEVIKDFKALSGRAHLSVPYNSSKVVAIGEVGLDYYRNLSPKEEQIAAFRKFIDLARELDLPLIIHSREANEDVLKTLRVKGQGSRVKGVIHCFSGDETFLKKCLDLGLYVSFTCNLTFKNAGDLRKVAKAVPVERLLLETDAPFLAPQKYRGKRNEPAYLTYLVDEWVELTGLTQDDIERITTHNANALFKIYPAEKPRIAYEIRDSLYLNITNRCTNLCNFCIRTKTDFVKGHNLSLDKEPTVDEILKAVGDPAKYNEIVFCGYGEPMMRLDVVKSVAKELKSKRVKVRLVTNGHGDLINSRPIAAELKGLVDKVSVSLNAESEEKYNELCAPKFGPNSFKSVVEFIKDCVRHGIETEVTCLDIDGIDLNKCEEIAKGAGAKFRLRRYGITG